VEKREIRTELRGEYLKRFEWLKRELGCHTDAECVRIIVNDFYKALKKREGEPLILRGVPPEEEDCKPFSPKEELGGETGYE